MRGPRRQRRGSAFTYAWDQRGVWLTAERAVPCVAGLGSPDGPISVFVVGSYCCRGMLVWVEVVPGSFVRGLGPCGRDPNLVHDIRVTRAAQRDNDRGPPPPRAAPTRPGCAVPARVQATTTGTRNEGPGAGICIAAEVGSLSAAACARIPAARSCSGCCMLSLRLLLTREWPR